VTRVFGEDGALVAAQGGEVDEIARLEAAVLDGDRLPARGLWIDGHVHLGEDRDGHRLGVAGLFADMDRCGVSAAVCFPPDDPGPDGSFRAANDLVLAAAAATPERVIPFCRLDPGSPGWGEEMDRCASAGAVGLKLHPVAQRFAPESGACTSVVRAATERGWPVLVHAGYGARALAEPIRALAAAVPRARLIMAHGGRGDARALREAVAGRSSVVFDTSLASLPDLVALPPERLVFGSDRPYGDHTTALHLVSLAAGIAKWSEDQVEGVMWRNLREWL
jgi:predicted TIM-barrel fold metal-dependent hydrolase